MESKDRETRCQFIIRKINILDLNKKEHICKILLAHEIELIQSNNGVYTSLDKFSDELINVVFDYLLVNLK